MKTRPAIHALILLLLGLMLAAPAWATHLLLGLDAKYTIDYNTMKVTLECPNGIENVDRVAGGNVRLELWATTELLSISSGNPASYDYRPLLSATGDYLLASYSVGPMPWDGWHASGSYNQTKGITLDPLSVVPPPPGDYYIAMVVIEEDSGIRHTRHFKTDSSRTHFSGLGFVSGNAYITFPGNQLRIQTPPVKNYSNLSSGSFKIEVYFATAAFDWNNPPNMYLIGTYSQLTALGANAQTAAIDQTVNLAYPPPGSYSAVLILKEYTAQGYTGRAFVKFPGSWNVAADPVAAPTFSPAGGTYTGSVAVTLATSTVGAKILYTLQAAPAVPNIEYTGPVNLTYSYSTQVLRAKATKAGMADSAVTSASFKVNRGTVATPVITPRGGYLDWHGVTITCATAGATIRYTSNGSDPNDGSDPTTPVSPVYSGNFALGAGEGVIKARAYLTGNIASATASVNLWLPGGGGVPTADAGWDIQEIIPAAGSINSLFDAEAILKRSDAGDVLGSPATVVLTAQAPVINRHDPDNPGGGGFFKGDVPYSADNLTPHGKAGANGGDDDNFLLLARCWIVIAEEDDYTFGFSSDDGARLIIYGAPFISSTRLNSTNPSNPAHSGVTLKFPGNTPNSDTLGVCHLTPGTYGLEFLTWEAGGGAYCEVFAARGAKTAMDPSFHLIGDRATAHPSLTVNSGWVEPGWRVVQATGAGSLSAAMDKIYTRWTDGAAIGKSAAIAALRFTSGNDFPDRDPITYRLEGTHGDPLTGPWDFLASGNTGLTTARNSAGPTVSLPGFKTYPSYRVTFPNLRESKNAIVQIGEVEFLDAAGAAVTRPTDPVVPTSGNSPAGETVEKAIDSDPWTKYLNFDGSGSGFTVTPSGPSYPVINFVDPQSGAGGHGHPQTVFPGDTGADDNYFAVGARSKLIITQSNLYTFCILGDDGTRLRILGSRGWEVSSPDPAQTQPQALPDGMQINAGCNDVFGTVHLTAGTYDIELIYNERSGAAHVGLWSATGRQTTWGTAFSLLGIEAVLDDGSIPIDNQHAAPVNDNFANALVITGNEAQVTGTLVNATKEAWETQPAWSTSIWWKWTAPQAARYWVSLGGSDNALSDIAIYVPAADLFGYPSGEINAVNQTRDDRGDGYAFDTFAGETYWFRVSKGQFSTAGRVLLTLSQPPPVQYPANDGFANAINLGNGTSISTIGSTHNGTVEPGEPDHDPSSSNNSSHSVWFAWTAPYSGPFVVDTLGSQSDTMLAVYTGSSVNSLTRVAANARGVSATESRLVFSATVGTTYHIALDGVSGDGSYFMNITPVPVITSCGFLAGSSNGVFQLNWRSEPYMSYRIDQSPDMKTWNTIRTGFNTTDISSYYSITRPSGTPRMFFRISRE